MKKLFFRSCCTVLAGVTGISLATAPQVLANGRHITCGSVNYGYTYCHIYTGGRARIGHQISHKPCVEGQSWGHDSQGVWVDRGCRADFIVDEGYGSYSHDGGYNSRHDYSASSYPSNSNSDNDDIGAALGVAAGAVILGALIGSAGSSNSSNHNSDYNSNYSDRHRSNIPSWAIGSFRGRNRQYNSEVDLTITPSGQAYATVNGGSTNGFFDGRVLSFKGLRFEVRRNNNGLTTIEEGNYQNQVDYYRYR